MILKLNSHNRLAATIMKNREEQEDSFLIVDDDEIFSQVLARAINKRGFQTHIAHNIADGLTQALTNHPNKAIIDLKLKDESGLELVAKLKALNPSIKMLILTGYSSIATAVNAIKLGADNYLCKPADTDEILAALDATCSESTELPIAAEPPSVDRMEWEHIQKVLKDNNGNISATARSLGMHRRTLQRKLNKRPVKR